jgi:hypothetical protein
MFVAPGPIDDVAHLRKSSGSVHHSLLVPCEVVTEVGHLLKCLSYARHVAVAEDPPDTSEERELFPVAGDILVS